MPFGKASAADALGSATEQRKLLSLAAALAGIGYWRLDLATGRVVWSDEVYRIHGLSPSAFDPNLADAVQYYHTEDRPLVRGYIERAQTTGVGFDFQLRLHRADGALRHVSSKAESQRNADGAISALVGAFLDVTEQVEALERAQSSERRYRLLAENGSDLITEMNEAGYFTYVSPSVRTITGFSPEEVVGTRALDFILPADRKRVRTAFHRLSSRGKGWTIEYRVPCKDGRVIWVEARPSFLGRSDQAGGSFVTDVIRDVTERKRDEAALLEAKAQAEVATSVKSEFLANMSHELRTPLTSIIGFSKLLHERDDLPEPATRHVRRVYDGARSLLSIVNDILDFSKLEAGQTDISPRPMSPRDLAEDVVTLFSLQAQSRRLQLSTTLDVGVPDRLVLDPDRLRQVLSNLISNAVKFTRSGKVGLGLSYRSGVLHCEIIDTGPGIAPDRIHLLFKRFSQIDGSTTRATGGTGLGLAICKGLIEAMGGRVGVDSIEGQGSRFWFEVPAPVAPGNDDQLHSDVKELSHA